MAKDYFCKILIYGRVNIHCEGVDNIKNYEKWTSIVPFLVHLKVQLPIIIKLYFFMTHLARLNLEIHFVFTFILF